MSLVSWALPQLQRLLDLDEESLKQIINYTDTLPRQAAADHLKNLLGDTPQALEFVSSFNSRRPNPPGEHVGSDQGASSRDVSESGVPRATPKSKKKKQDFNRLPPPRQPEHHGMVSGGYTKKEQQDDYISSRNQSSRNTAITSTLSLREKSDPTQQALPTSEGDLATENHNKLPPSAAGSLIADGKRSSSPAAKPKAKINVSGGASMRGQSSTLNDLDSAIRALETQTNPTLSSKQEDSLRRCNCMAQRHELLTAAPNCINCGKIICAKEGIGPCTFCGQALLSSQDIQDMVRVLRDQRGKERMQMNNATQKRAEVSTTPRPFSSRNTPVSSAPSSDSESDKFAAAKQHRDKLLKFQTENAQRTQIHDEAADFETPDAGQSMWATPQERALQLKKQQKVLREQEWNARPEYEKRQMVVSIDVIGGKAVRKMASVDQPSEQEIDGEDNGSENRTPEERTTGGRGSFSRNPLLGGLIRPVYPNTGKGKEKSVLKNSQTTWRRVQDDYADNEEVILDGGAYGNRIDGRVLSVEEHAIG